jgi:hypothetical protein
MELTNWQRFYSLLKEIYLQNWIIFSPFTSERHASVQRPDVPDSISLGLECKFSVENASFMASSESIVENDKQDTKENASTEGNGSQYGDNIQED